MQIHRYDATGKLKTSAGAGGGDALTTDPLSQFAATSSAQLRGVLNDETGNGLAYFQNGDAGTPSALVGTNITGTAAGLTAGAASAVAVGGITGMAAGVGTFLATPSSANLRAALTDESGTGLAYFQGGDAGTPSALVGTNITGTAAGLTAGNVTTNANLTGPVTSAGNATTITDGAVTLAKMADLAQDAFIVRTTASTGVPETATCTAAARTVLDDATVGAMVNTLGGSSSTGTNGLVRETSPTIVTPTIASFTNATHTHANAAGGGTLDAAVIATGTIAPARLGSGSGGATKFLREDSSFQTIAAGGDALVANPLSQFAATTSAQLRGVLSDETGGGLAMFNEGPVIAAGTASANSWPKLTTGTRLTTPEAGAMELAGGGLYATAAASQRGSWVIEHWIRQAASRTLTNTTNEQAIFDSVAGGTLTIETGVFFFESMLYLTGMSGSSGNLAFSLIGSGTATLADRLYHAIGIDAATPTNAAAQTGSFTIINKSVASIVSAAAQSVMGVSIRGTFEVTVAGTIIPTLDLVDAAAATLVEGSYFKCHRVGEAGDVSCGNWS